MDFAAFAGLDQSLFTASDGLIASFDPADDAALRPFRVAIERFKVGPTRRDLARFLVDIMEVLEPAMKTWESEGAPLWLRRAVESMRIEENLRGGVAALSALAHVSAAHLSHCTGRYFGMTPTALVSELRLRHAAFLLRTTSDGIRTIAQRCGFSSLAYFSTTFRRSFHIAPRDYRNRNGTSEFELHAIPS